jgi:hypothetical protein
MENTNLGPFKPLSEDQEKLVTGGAVSPLSQCVQLEDRVYALAQQIESLEKQGLPPSSALTHELATLKHELNVCLSGLKPTSPSNFI